MKNKILTTLTILILFLTLSFTSADIVEIARETFDSQSNNQLEGFGEPNYDLGDETYAGGDDGSFAMVIGKNECAEFAGRKAKVTFTTTEDFIPTKIIIRHLDGTATDSYYLSINNKYLLGYYNDQGTEEQWKTTEFSAPRLMESSKTLEVEITAQPGSETWSGCEEWGQLAISEIIIEGTYQCIRNLQISPRETKTKHGENFLVDLRYERVCENANDYFALHFNKHHDESTTDFIANAGYTKDELCQGTIDQSCQETKTIEVETPCELGIYDLHILGASGQQEGYRAPWRDYFTSGFFKEKRPGDLTYIRNELNEFAEITSATDFQIAQISPVQVITDVNLIEEKDTVVRVKLATENSLWPNSDWPSCRENGNIENVEVTINYEGKIESMTKSLKKIDVIAENSQEYDSNIFKGNDTFNFYVEAPEKGEISYSAIVNPLETIPETDTLNNADHISIKVKKAPTSIKISYVQVGELADSSDFNEIINKQHKFLTAVYPFPENSIIKEIITNPQFVNPNEERLAQTLRLLEQEAALQGVDFIVGIFPAEHGALEGNAGNTIPLIYKKSAIVSEIAHNFVTAHEIGHLNGLEHQDDTNSQGENGNIAAPGFDVKAETAKMSTSIIYGDREIYYALMRERGGFILTWITRESFNTLAEKFIPSWKTIPTVSCLPGDATSDGKVDIFDFSALANNYGKQRGATLRQGDFNNDGAVNVLDLGILGSNYGQDVGECVVA